MPHRLGLIGVYAKAGVAAIPGAGRLPILPGGGGPLPTTVRRLTAATIPAEQLGKLRGLTDDRGSGLPLLAPHFLAFPLHMQAMTDGAFPYPAIGTVHLENLVERHVALTSDQPLDIAVQLFGPHPHRKGATFRIETTAHADGQLVWRELSTMLRIGAQVPPLAPELTPLDLPEGDVPGAGATAADWSLPADLGRSWGMASGDLNPIHLSGISAKAFGFPRAIAHGMWTAARIAAQLGDAVPAATSLAVRFEKPILLPASPTLHSWTPAGSASTDLLVTSKAGEIVHARARLTPLA